MPIPSTLTSVLAIATCSLAAWGGHPGQDASTGMDPDAQKLLERMGKFYDSLDAATFKATMEMSDSRLPSPISITTSSAIGRPNLLSTRGIGSPAESQSIRASSDGTTLTIAAPFYGLYSTAPAPASFESLIDQTPAGDPTAESSPLEILSTDPTLMIAIALFNKNPASWLPEGSDSVTVEGEETFNGTPAIKLNLDRSKDVSEMEASPAANSTLWIAKGDEPWLLGLQPKLDEEDVQGMKILVTYSDWKAGAPTEGYAIKIDDDWKKVDNIMESAMAAAREQLEATQDESGMDPDQPAPDHPTIGKAAPDFTLKTLVDSREVSLASLKGKVVVLDFWATWCAPCIAGLPTMDEVTGRFKDQGVEFFAVDLRESTERVRKFMDGKKWDFTVLMDEQGGVAREFGVGGIPHSVLIDREGVIRHVHIGFGGKEELERKLTEELTGLVADGGDRK